MPPRFSTAHRAAAIGLLSLIVGLSGCGAPAPYRPPYLSSLPACPTHPNCVSSEEVRAEAQVAPLSFDKVPPYRAWAALKEAIRAEGGVIQREGMGALEAGYLRATFTSWLFRFVDDVECRLVVQDGLIHIRSAARVGYYDFGVNRRRVERLRQAFAEALQQP